MENKKTLVLTGEAVKGGSRADYIIDYIDIDEDSLIKLADLLEYDEDNFDDPKDEALDWFLSNYDEEKIEVTARKFYNETISKTDIEVNYKSKYIAEYQDTEIVFNINMIGLTEMYDNEEAKSYLED